MGHRGDQTKPGTRTDDVDRSQIEGLKVGDVLERTFDLEPVGSPKRGQPTVDAHWAFRGEVTDIEHRVISADGKSCVRGYTRLGAKFWMSFRINEGDESIRIVSPGTSR